MSLFMKTTNKVTRQNREYLERIKELEKQLANKNSTEIIDERSPETESSNDLLSLIDDEDCKVLSIVLTLYRCVVNLSCWWDRASQPVSPSP